jgi:hypothetical protein
MTAGAVVFKRLAILVNNPHAIVAKLVRRSPTLPQDEFAICDPADREFTTDG